MKLMLLLCVTALLSGWGAAVSALSLAHYEQARTLFVSQDKVSDYRLSLGTLKKVDGDWRAEREQPLNGQLSRLTQELDEGHSEKAVFEFYRQQILKMGGQELFLCESRRCGSSATWANQRFGIKELYGLDQHQHYSALAVDLEDGQRAFVAVYTVRRGNKRSYAQVDVLTSANRTKLFSSPEVVSERLRAGNQFRLPELNNGQLTADQLTAVVSALRAQRSWHIAIVGLDTGEGSLAQQQERSLALATGLQQQLIAAGLTADRLQVFGLGGLSPDDMPKGSTSSVNLVKITP
jgi:hypothetical protein